MKKTKFFFLTLLAGLLMSVSAWGATSEITLKFTRTSSTAATVSVTGAEGTTATVSCTKNYQTWTGSNKDKALVPAVNLSSSPNYTFTFTLSNVPEDFVFDGIDADVYAFTGSGGSQNAGNTRHCNMKYTVNGSDFATLTNADIANSNAKADGDITGIIHSIHKAYSTYPATFTRKADGSMVITLNVTKGKENPGSFFGLYSIRLYTYAKTEIAKAQLSTAITDAQANLADAANYDGKTGTEVSKYTQTGTTEALTQAISDAQTFYSGITSDTPDQDIFDAVTTLKSKFITFTLNLPQQGHFYLLRSINVSKYINITTAGSTTALVDEASSASIMCYREDGKLMALENGLYVKDVKSSTATATDGETVTFGELISTSESGKVYNAFYVQTSYAGNNYWGAGSSATTLGSNQFNNYNACRFDATEVDVTASYDLYTVTIAAATGTTAPASVQFAKHMGDKTLTVVNGSLIAYTKGTTPAAADFAVTGYDVEVVTEGGVLTLTYTASKSAAWLALNAKITEAQAIVVPTGPWGTDPGYYDQDAAEALPTAITTAQGVLETTATDEVYQAATVALQGAMDAVKIIVPVVGKTYQLISAFPTFETTHGAKMAIYNNEGTNLRWMTLNNNNRAFYWTVTAVDGNSVTFQSLKDGKYPSTFNTNDQPVPLTTDVTACTLASLGDGQFKITAGTSKAALHAGNHGNGTNNNGNVMIWDTGKDGCSAWYIHEAEAPSVANITYKVMEGGSQIWSTVVEGAIGQPFPTATAPNTFITLGGYPTGNVEGEGTYELTYTVASRIPQTFAAVDENTVYYALDIHGNQGDAPVYGSSDAANMNLRVKYDNSHSGARVADGDVNDYMRGAVENDRYAWAFIGDVFNGVKLYNKGRNEYCSFDGAVNGQRDSYPATFVAEVSSASVFQFKAMKSNDTGSSFALKNESASNPLNFLNHNTNNISGWTEADGGSGFRVYEITPATAADAVEYTFNADYGTLIVPFYAEIPEDLEVYTCSALSGNVLTLTAETSMIKPGVPYIIKSEEYSEFEFLGGSKLTTPTTATVGLLTGVYENTGLLSVITAAGSTNTAYVLTKVGERAAFQYIDPEDYPTGAQVGANRCYLLQPKGGEVKATLYFDEETGINNVDVDANVDGKFLENGRIVIVKNNAKYNVAGQSLK